MFTKQTMYLRYEIEEDKDTSTGHVLPPIHVKTDSQTLTMSGFPITYRQAEDLAEVLSEIVKAYKENGKERGVK